MTRTPAPAAALDPVVLRRDGVAVVIDPQPTGLPAVLHWGADPGPLDPRDLAALRSATSRQSAPGTLDAAWQVPLLPQEPDGWAGRPGLALARDGVALTPRWTVDALVTGPGPDGPASVEVRAHDPHAGLDLALTVAVEPGGLVTLAHRLRNAGPAPVAVGHLEATLPVPTTADVQMTFSGRWPREKVPTTGVLPRGAVARQTRRGRPGHDHPWLLALSTTAPRNRTGEVWGVHLAWSADATYRTDRLPEHTTLLGAGELLRAGELVLAPGEEYAAPAAHFAWSGAGLDGLSARFHAYLRSRPQHPRRPRPLVLNTWEAVYFDHDPATVLRLAERAAAVGVERFVLDDGWFLARRDDTRGLGDWEVDTAVWPDGLRPLTDRVRELGMEPGLWFEPEMVNLDSRLAREHPDWLLHDPAQVPSPDGLSWRTQYVLDVARPEVADHLFERISALVSALGLAFLKWDHNRDLVDARHAGRPGVHAQTRAALALMARVKAAHPGLEIESCSSGGARSDLGVLAVTDRVWASDTNDAVERQDIQRWTGLLLPPELVGAHVGPPTAHSTGRTVDLSYRLATSLMGHAGFEWDLLECGPEEVATLTAFGALYRELRGLVHTGTAVHADTRDPALRVTGAVAPDGSAAVYTVATVAALEDARPERVPLPGLDPDRRYRVRLRDEVGPARAGWTIPQWLADGGVELSGRALATVGLQLPPLWPAQALVLHAVAVG